jgi:hypothetical protein
MFRLLFLLLISTFSHAQTFDLAQYDGSLDTLRADTLIVSEVSNYDGGTYIVRSRAYLVHTDTIPGMAVLLDTITTRDDLGATVVHYGLRVVPGFAVRHSLFTEYFTAIGDRIKPEDLFQFKPHE